MQFGSLRPAAPGIEERGESTGEQTRLLGQTLIGRVPGDRERRGLLRLQPALVVIGPTCRRLVGRGVDGNGKPGTEPEDRTVRRVGEPKVVTHQTANGEVAVAVGVLVTREVQSVLADEVVERETTGHGLVDQVVIRESIERLPDVGERLAGGHRRGGVTGEVQSGVERDLPQQASLPGGQIVTGEGERGAHGTISRAVLSQPDGQIADFPGGMAPKLASGELYFQGQVVAQPQHAGDGRAIEVIPSRRLHEQGSRVGWRHPFQRKPADTGEVERLVPRGDNDQAARGAGQERLDLGGIERVVEKDQHLPAREPGSPEGGAIPGIGRDDGVRNIECAQQGAERRPGVNRPVGVGVPAQLYVQLIGIAVRVGAGGVDGECGLAHAGRPADHDNWHGRLGQAVLQPAGQQGQFPGAASEVGIVPGHGVPGGPLAAATAGSRGPVSSGASRSICCCSSRSLAPGSFPVASA